MSSKDTDINELNTITYKIRKAIFEVNKNLGPGLMEKVYEQALEQELHTLGLKVRRQCKVPVNYKGVEYNQYFRIDLLVEDQIIIELKSVEILTDLHKHQVLTYMKQFQKRIGILVNFNSVYMKDKSFNLKQLK